MYLSGQRRSDLKILLIVDPHLRGVRVRMLHLMKTSTFVLCFRHSPHAQHKRRRPQRPEKTPESRGLALLLEHEKIIEGQVHFQSSE